MHRLLVVAAFVWMSVAIDAAALPSDVKEGQELYVDLCASCHGIDATGKGPVTPALKVPPPDLTRLAQRHAGTFPRDLVIEMITGERPVAAHGSREMPVWSQRFGPRSSAGAAVASIYMRRRVERIAGYIESLQRSD